MSQLSSVDLRIGTDIHFVSYRNNLNKIMETPYNRRDAWRIHLRRTRGTVYMDVVKLPDQSTQSAADRARFTFWGYKFEQMCTERGNRPDEKVDANEEYCSVFKISIGSSRIILAAEIDCATAPAARQGSQRAQAEPVREYVELKTSRQIEHQRQQENFERHKLLKFWIQSFLGCVLLCFLFLFLFRFLARSPSPNVPSASTHHNREDRRRALIQYRSMGVI